MDDFLRICQWVYHKLGYTGSLITVASQSADRANVVAAVQEADQSLCALYQDWRFLEATEERAVVANTAVYAAPGDLGNYNRAPWRYEVDGEATLLNVLDGPFVDLDDETGTPVFALVQPDDTVRLKPIPDQNATLTLSYRKRAPLLTDNTDQPLIPREYRFALAWAAVVILADVESDVALTTVAREHAARWLGLMVADQLPGHWELHSGSTSGSLHAVRPE
jgi:hypothetical protein